LPWRSAAVERVAVLPLHHPLPQRLAQVVAQVEWQLDALPADFPVGLPLPWGRLVRQSAAQRPVGPVVIRRLGHSWRQMAARVAAAVQPTLGWLLVVPVVP
jgi:hypothetical protein